tara:strand:- start:2081 stop:3415 length:1335 start_codon:yes stop_codon:yes gene_type:complete
MNRTEIKSQFYNIIDSHKNQVITYANFLNKNSELGFFEFKSSEYIYNILYNLGLKPKKISTTGLEIKFSGINPGPTIAVIAELDGLTVPGHPFYNIQNKAAHACGHHTQSAILLAIIITLCNSDFIRQINGSIKFIFTPAEELIDINNRIALYENNKISFLSGKQDLISLGTFDEVSLAIMTHSAPLNKIYKVSLGGKTNANQVHRATFYGKSSHAGGYPDKGINSSQAAYLSNLSINNKRINFDSNDNVRIHGVYSNDNNSINTVPNKTYYEGKIRVKHFDKLKNITQNIFRSYIGSAKAVGCDLLIEKFPGYHPLIQDSNLISIIKDNALVFYDEKKINHISDDSQSGGSTDMGDISTLMPVVHPLFHSAEGEPHSENFVVTNNELGIFNPAKIIAGSIVDIMTNLHLQKQIIESYKRKYSIQKYLSIQNNEFEKITVKNMK